MFLNELEKIWEALMIKKILVTGHMYWRLK